MCATFQPQERQRTPTYMNSFVEYMLLVAWKSTAYQVFCVPCFLCAESAHKESTRYVYVYAYAPRSKFHVRKCIRWGIFADEISQMRVEHKLHAHCQIARMGIIKLWKTEAHHKSLSAILIKFSRRRQMTNIQYCCRLNCHRTRGHINRLWCFSVFHLKFVCEH